MVVIRRGFWFLLLTGTFGALLLAGCATVPQFDLTETMELPGTGYSIDYPAGWYVEILEPLGWAVMSQNEVELASGMVSAGGNSAAGTWSSGSGKSSGHEVWFQKASKGNVAASGATARDVFSVVMWLGWKAPDDDAIRDVVIADVSAAMAELSPPPSAALFYVALYDDAYLLRVQAPTEKELERFMPTWEKMLQSIKSVGG